ncbi:hypothetical protein [Adonisia turfae]|uniref:hypothetical protein n=1 Tax=Adonisia turfae TaxID=2950184 RepID=UPI0013D7D459|nr:hypothetical protein [Adonisia turfae]
MPALSIPGWGDTWCWSWDRCMVWIGGGVDSFAEEYSHNKTTGKEAIGDRGHPSPPILGGIR